MTLDVEIKIIVGLLEIILDVEIEIVVGLVDITLKVEIEPLGNFFLRILD